MRKELINWRMILIWSVLLPKIFISTFKIKVKPLIKLLKPPKLRFTLLQMMKVTLQIKMPITLMQMKTLKFQLVREVTINKIALRLSRRENSSKIHVKIVHWKERFATDFLKMSDPLKFTDLFCSLIFWLTSLHPKLTFMLNRMKETLCQQRKK